MKNLISRCVSLTKLCSFLLVGLVGIQIVLLLSIVMQPIASTGKLDSVTTILLLLTWLLWLIVQISNWMLVRCGSQRERYRYAPGFINRSEFGIRLFVHLLINWSVLATTLTAAILLPDGRLRISLSWIILAATVITWLSFNLQHRRENRLRNLSLSTFMAASLFLLTVPMLIE